MKFSEMSEEAKERHREVCRANYRKNRERLLAKQAAFRAQFPELVAERKRRWRKQNLARQRAYNRKWAANNSEILNKHRKVYREERAADKRLFKDAQNFVALTQVGNALQAINQN